MPLRQLAEATKTNKQTNKQKARISHLKLHPVSSFATRISGLHTFGRKQVVNNDFFASQPCTRNVRLDLAKDFIQNRRRHAFAQL